MDVVNKGLQLMVDLSTRVSDLTHVFANTPEHI
jgi:hypothetical protein